MKWRRAIRVLDVSARHEGMNLQYPRSIVDAEFLFVPSARALRVFAARAKQQTRRRLAVPDRRGTADGPLGVRYAGRRRPKDGVAQYVDGGWNGAALRLPIGQSISSNPHGRIVTGGSRPAPFLAVHPGLRDHERRRPLCVQLQLQACPRHQRQGVAAVGRHGERLHDAGNGLIRVRRHYPEGSERNGARKPTPWFCANAAHTVSKAADDRRSRDTASPGTYATRKC